MWVFDATPLIYLAKVDRIDLVQRLDESCVIPDRVYCSLYPVGDMHRTQLRWDSLWNQ